MAKNFRDRAMVWYMKFHTTVPTCHTRTLAVIKTALILEFEKLKCESSCITELKEIKHIHNETIWDFDQRFMSLIHRLTFQILLQQHKEWFIVSLLPHIRLPVVKHRLASQLNIWKQQLEWKHPLQEKVVWGWSRFSHNQLC